MASRYQTGSRSMAAATSSAMSCDTVAPSGESEFRRVSRLALEVQCADDGRLAAHS